MTAKEKAKDLFDGYYYCLLQSNIEKRNYWSKQCALIAVDMIINSNPHSNPFNTTICSTMEYWQEVKHELEKL
jgi:hypothetical protein